MNFDDEITREITKRTRLFVLDNYSSPTEHDYHLIKGAMLVGALIYAQYELNVEEEAIKAKQRASAEA